MPKKDIIYDDDDDFPQGEIEILENFLPPPEQILFPEDPVKNVTIKLNESIIDYFKREAEKHGSKYQRMIRVLLMKYVRIYDKNPYQPKLVPGKPLTKAQKAARLKRQKKRSKKK